MACRSCESKPDHSASAVAPSASPVHGYFSEGFHGFNARGKPATVLTSSVQPGRFSAAHGKHRYAAASHQVVYIRQTVRVKARQQRLTSEDRREIIPVNDNARQREPSPPGVASYGWSNHRLPAAPRSVDTAHGISANGVHSITVTGRASTGVRRRRSARLAQFGIGCLVTTRKRTCP